MLQRRRSAGRLLLCKSSALNTSTTSTKGSITLVLHCENQTLSRTTTKPPAPNENDVLKPERNPLVYAPVFQPFVPPARPPFSPVFLSGLRFVNVTWTPQKTKEIKQRRFEVALGSFKLGYDVPFLATYQKIHERKSKKQKKIEEKEEIEERNREKAFKKSLHGYEESWRQLWGRQMSYAYVPVRILQFQIYFSSSSSFFFFFLLTLTILVFFVNSTPILCPQRTSGKQKVGSFSIRRICALIKACQRQRQSISM